MLSDTSVANRFSVLVIWSNPKRKTERRGGDHEAPNRAFPITVEIPSSPSDSAGSAAASAAAATAAAAAAAADAA